MTDNTLNLLGLALRGGNLAVGEEPVAEACRLNRAKLVLTASDAAVNSKEKAARLAERSGIPHIPLPRSKAQTGGALGRSSCAVLAVTDAGLAAALAERLASEDGSLRPLAHELAEKAGRKKRETNRGRTPSNRAHRNIRRWPV